MENLMLYKSSDLLKNSQASQEDYFNHYYIYKPPTKLFSFFAHELIFNNTEFLKKLDKEFRKSFEEWAEKKINFNKIEILVLPTGSDLELYKNLETDRLVYRIFCHVGPTYGAIGGHILWYINKPFIEIDFYYTDKFDDELVVEWIPIHYTRDVKEEMPEYQAKIPKLKFKSKLKFPVFSWLDSLPHEGKFAITLEDINDKEKVSEILGYGLRKWNTQTNQARTSGDLSLERGYCHTITFEGVANNIGYWYIDVGSADDDIDEFLLKELSDSGIKIKSVEIQML